MEGWKQSQMKVICVSYVFCKFKLTAIYLTKRNQSYYAYLPTFLHVFFRNTFIPSEIIHS